MEVKARLKGAVSNTKCFAVKPLQDRQTFVVFVFPSKMDLNSEAWQPSGNIKHKTAQSSSSVGGRTKERDVPKKLLIAVIQKIERDRAELTICCTIFAFQ